MKRGLGGAAVALVLALAAGDAGAQAFSRADANRDGFVTFEEARRVMPRLNQNHFRQCDRDRDGRLSAAEWNCMQGLYNAIERS